MCKTTFRHKSRVDYETSEVTYEQIQTGCLQRIADAIEAMGKSYTKLQEEFSDMTRRKEYWEKEAEESQRLVTAQKRAISRLKKLLADG